MTVARNEDRAVYRVNAIPARIVPPASEVEDQLITEALSILSVRLRKRVDGTAMSSPSAVRAYCMLRIGALEHEVFLTLFLTAQNQLIAAEELFRGTLTQTSVYPREVVKAALAHNAAAVILCHNHPSGAVEPSNADRWITDSLKSALALIDVKVLDHIVVAGAQSMSFAERGLV